MWRLTKDLLRINSIVVSQDMEDVICAWILQHFALRAAATQAENTLLKSCLICNASSWGDACPDLMHGQT